MEAVFHLGDIVDGNEDLASTRADLEAVLSALSYLKPPVWHVLGNHCLAAGREHVLQRVKYPSGYYKLDFGDWVVVVLDTVDISVDREEPFRSKALKYLEDHKGEPNANDWNGGLGDEQNEWLRDVLRSAPGNVLVCGHLPMFCKGTDEHILWEAEELHETFVEFGVRAYFSGHYHGGDYVCKDGVHYVTFESIIDSVDEEGAYGVVELSDRKIDIRGFGDMTSRVLQF